MTHDVETEAGRKFCSDLMDIDDSFGIKSSFQIVPEGCYQVSDAFLASLRERGFEVAVHDLNHDGHLYRTENNSFSVRRKLTPTANSMARRAFGRVFCIESNCGLTP